MLNVFDRFWETITTRRSRRIIDGNNNATQTPQTHFIPIYALNSIQDNVRRPSTSRRNIHISYAIQYHSQRRTTLRTPENNPLITPLTTTVNLPQIQHNNDMGITTPTNLQQRLDEEHHTNTINNTDTNRKFYCDNIVTDKSSHPWSDSCGRSFHLNHASIR